MEKKLYPFLGYKTKEEYAQIKDMKSFDREMLSNAIPEINGIPITLMYIV